MNRVNNSLKILLICIISLVGAVFFYSQEVIASGECIAVYEYRLTGPWWPRCNTFSPIWSRPGETAYTQWIRLCKGTPGCRECWWPLCTDGTGYCFGKWYDFTCEEDDAGETFTCDCGNTITCPTATPTPSPSPSPSPTPSNQYPGCSSLALDPIGTPVNSYVKGNTITMTVTATDPENNLNKVDFYYTPVQVNYCVPSPSWIHMGTGTRSGNIFTLNYDTSSLNYGDYMIVANVTDNGSPSLYCTGNPNCTSPSDCCGLSGVTSCANCKKQIEIKPACDTSFVMSSTSDCNNTILSLSNIPATHVIATGYDPNNVTSGSVSGCTPGTTATGPINCSAIAAGSFTWTHYYQDCIGGKCSNVCFKQYIGDTAFVPAPTCPPNFSCQAEPAPIYYGQDTSLSAYIQNVDPNLVITPAAPIVEGFNCTSRETIYTPPLPSNLSTISDKWACGTPIPDSNYSFTYNFTYLSDTCPGASTVCSCSLTPTPTMPPGYLTTSAGDVFIRGAADSSAGFVSQVGYPVSLPYRALSTFSFSTGFANSNTDIILGDNLGPCNDTPTNTICSTQRYLLLNYQDHNTTMGTYGYLNALLETRSIRGSIRLEETDRSTINYLESLANNFDVIRVLGDMTVSPNSECNDKVVFLIEGDLNIAPPFTIDPAHPTSACMFVVRGTTFVRDPGDEWNNLDEIHAFIVTDKIETEYKRTGDQLRLTGGLIISSPNTADTSFNRNINTDPLLPLSNEPSEYLIYEGGRYMANLKHILYSPFNASIVEPQYIDISY